MEQNTGYTYNTQNMGFQPLGQTTGPFTTSAGPAPRGNMGLAGAATSPSAEFNTAGVAYQPHVSSSFAPMDHYATSQQVVHNMSTAASQAANFGNIAMASANAQQSAAQMSFVQPPQGVFNMNVAQQQQMQRPVSNMNFVQQAQQPVAGMVVGQQQFQAGQQFTPSGVRFAPSPSSGFEQTVNQALVAAFHKGATVTRFRVYSEIVNEIKNFGTLFGAIRVGDAGITPNQQLLESMQQWMKVNTQFVDAREPTWAANEVRTDFEQRFPAVFAPGSAQAAASSTFVPAPAPAPVAPLNTPSPSSDASHVVAGNAAGAASRASQSGSKRKQQPDDASSSRASKKSKASSPSSPAAVTDAAPASAVAPTSAPQPAGNAAQGKAPQQAAWVRGKKSQTAGVLILPGMAIPSASQSQPPSDAAIDLTTTPDVESTPATVDLTEAEPEVEQPKEQTPEQKRMAEVFRLDKSLPASLVQDFMAPHEGSPYPVVQDAARRNSGDIAHYLNDRRCREEALEIYDALQAQRLNVKPGERPEWDAAARKAEKRLKRKQREIEDLKAAREAREAAAAARQAPIDQTENEASASSAAPEVPKPQQDQTATKKDPLWADFAAECDKLFG